MASDGSWSDAAQKMDGAPSVLYDAIALLPAECSAQTTLNLLPARDCIADAFAHRKCVAIVDAALRLLAKAGIAQTTELSISDASVFIKACGKLPYWPSESMLK